MSNYFGDEEVSKRRVMGWKKKAIWPIILGRGQRCRVKCALRLGVYCGGWRTYESGDHTGTICGCAKMVKKVNGKCYQLAYFP